MKADVLDAKDLIEPARTGRTSTATRSHQIVEATRNVETEPKTVTL